MNQTSHPEEGASGMNLAHLLDRAADQYADRLAVVFENEELSYADLAETTSRFAGGLQRLGVVPGDRVAVHLPNLPQFIIAIWGIMKAGAVPTPMNPQLRRREIAYQLRDADGKLLIGLVQYAEEIEAAAEDVGGIPLVTVGGESRHTRFRELLQAPAIHVERDDHDIALQPYTSGTTGLPKGVLLTHGNLVANANAITTLNPLPSEEDRVLVPIPMFHITGMTVMMLSPLTRGATVYPMLQWEAKEAMRLIEHHRITDFLAVPTIYIDMLRHPQVAETDFASLQVCVSGGAKIPVPVMQKFDQLGVPIYEGYGLTETSPVTHTNLAAPERVLGSIGWAIPETECKIVDENGREVPTGEAGELCIRGPQVMKGYHNQPESNEKAFDADGYFYTGDLAQVDDQGYFYIVDRVKDMINPGGFNVYPKEVEQVLYEHGAVAECAVVGVPDERKGETVKAFVVLNGTYDASDDLATELQEHCLREIAPYKHPRTIEFVTELPKTASGKIQKYRLRHGD